MDPMVIIVAVICLAIGAVAAYAYATNQSNARVAEANRQVADAKTQAERTLEDAERDAEAAKKAALVEAREEILQLRKESEADDRRRKGELQSLENRIMQREESLDNRNVALDRKESQLSSLQSSLDRRRNEVEGLYAQQVSELERIAVLTQEDAKAELLDRVRSEVVREEAQILRESEQRVRAQADKTAREIVSTAIQRCAADQAGEITVTSVHIPSDDLKGRIIGREGRNIRTFEQVSGVSLVIDDTPETVVLSSFDPVRRETARVALENLIAASACARLASRPRLTAASTTSIPSSCARWVRFATAPRLAKTFWRTPCRWQRSAASWPLSLGSLRLPPSAQVFCTTSARRLTTRSRVRMP